MMGFNISHFLKKFHHLFQKYCSTILFLNYLSTKMRKINIKNAKKSIKI